MEEPRLTKKLADQAIKWVNGIGGITGFLYPSTKKWKRVVVGLIKVARAELPEE